MRKNKDFFDRMFLRLLQKHPHMEGAKTFYLKYKEMLLYSFFGLGTFLIAFYSYMFFSEQVGMQILVANAVSWIFATTFAFITNRTWVFSNHARGVGAFFLQMGSFFLGRFITLVIEEAMLHVLVDQQGLPNMPIKFLSQVIVIILNYLISKLLVFRKRSEFIQRIREKKGEI
ncbi:MAG: GtrA family protein [Lachnospiraceae bacterium]|nr:GtrA family protein [Lachnospiraceae bacterium]